jgi:hypothetical protein
MLAVVACVAKPAGVQSVDTSVPVAAAPDRIPVVADAAVSRDAATAPSTEHAESPLPDGLATTEVDGARFGIEGRMTEYRRGELRIWVATGIPAADASAIARS